MLDKQLEDKPLETGTSQIYAKFHQLNNITLFFPHFDPAGNIQLKKFLMCYIGDQKMCLERALVL